MSSFGFGGTNGHIVLEEAPPEKNEGGRMSCRVQQADERLEMRDERSGGDAPSSLIPPVDRPRHLLTLSARSPQALSELVGRYAGFLESSPADPEYRVPARRHLLYRSRGSHAFCPSPGHSGGIARGSSRGAAIDGKLPIAKCKFEI